MTKTATSNNITRAITFSVATVEGGTWQDFMKSLHCLWHSGTEAANWAIQHYARTDCLPEPGKRMPKPPKLYVYPQLVARFPAISTGTLATIGRMTEKHYRKHRLKVWTGQEALPLYRYPMPYPIRQQDWQPVLVNGQRPGVTFLAGQPRKAKNGQPWTLVLSGGPGFHRQLTTFRLLLSGGAQKCDMAIYRQRCGTTHHADTSDKAPAGGSRVRYRIMCKLVVHMPRPVRSEAVGYVVLRTDPEALFVVHHDGRTVSPWVLNADDAKRWLARMHIAYRDHAARRQRMADDMKLERRVHVGHRQQMQDALDRMCSKHRRRVKTFIDQAAASAVNYCIRRKLSSLIYDDSERGWLPTFPWASLRTALRVRCANQGIHAGGVLEEDDEDTSEEVVEEVLIAANA